MNILVLIDMQNDFITGPLGTKEAQEILPRVVQKARDFDGLVLSTQDTHYSDYLETQEGKLLPVTHCRDGSVGWKRPPELYDVLPNHHKAGLLKSSFGSIALADYLYDLCESHDQLLDITLVGVCTDICVISNALLLKTYLPEAKITVDASCCAGTSPEAHENALKAMKQCQIFIENWSGNSEIMELI